jgi:hypothetical protein
VYFDVVEPLKVFLPDLEWCFGPYLVEIFVDIRYLYDLECYFEPLKGFLLYFVFYWVEIFEDRGYHPLYIDYFFVFHFE